MKGRLIFYKEMHKKGLLTKEVLDKLISNFTDKMKYPPEQVVVRSDEVTEGIRGLVTEVDNGLPPGHVILYPVIIREARIYFGERKPA